MKKYAIFIMLAALWSCQAEYETYQGEDAVFINEITDTTKVSFTYIDSEFSSEVKEIELKTIGGVYDYDRKVSIQVSLLNCLEGVDFEPLEKEYTVKAGEAVLYIPVVMKRTSELQKEAKAITVTLVENKDFKLYFEFGASDKHPLRATRLRHTVQFSEFMTQRPPTWDPYHFGDFTTKKFMLICDVMNISRSKFIDTNYMVGGRLIFTSGSMKKYLADEKTAGRTVYEEDGVTEMAMGRGAV